MSEQVERLTRELKGFSEKIASDKVRERQTLLENNLKKMRELSEKLSQIKDFSDSKVIGECIKEVTTFFSSDMFKSVQPPAPVATVKTSVGATETGGVITKTNIEKVTRRLHELSNRPILCENS